MHSPRVSHATPELVPRQRIASTPISHRARGFAAPACHYFHVSLALERWCHTAPAHAATHPVASIARRSVAEHVTKSIAPLAIKHHREEPWPFLCLPVPPFFIRPSLSPLPRKKHEGSTSSNFIRAAHRLDINVVANTTILLLFYSGQNVFQGNRFPPLKSIFLFILRRSPTTLSSLVLT